MRVEDLLRDQASFESQRSQFETTWQRIARLIYPAAAQFNTRDLEGTRRDQDQFDSTGALALPRFQAAMESVLCPRTQRWHELTVDDSIKELRKVPAVTVYLEQLNDIVFAARYNARANFSGASGEHFQSLGAFGNGCTFLDEKIGRHLIYKALFLGEVYIVTDGMGLVDGVHRKFELKARQAVGLFGANTPAELQQIATTRPEQPFDFLHCVRLRRDGYDPQRRDFRGMPFASCYVWPHRQVMIEEGGYRTLPYLFSRFLTAARETYGRGPASLVLPTLNTANEEKKTMLRAGQKAVDPPLMLPDEDTLQGFNLRAGALNFGAIGAQGQQLVQPLQTGANLPLGQEMLEAERSVINDAFYVTLFRILIEEPRITATEALLRAQEKGELLAPAMGPQQQEYFYPMVTRELDLLEHAGQLPPMPDELIEAGGLLKVEFTSPLNKLQKAGDGAAILRYFESVTPLAQVEPRVLRAVNPIRAAKKLAETQGVPADCLATDEELEADEQMEAQKQQAEALLAAAPVAGKTAKDLTDAAANAQATPNVGAMFG